MRPGEQFERSCYEYLKKTYQTNETVFSHEGGMDSTKSDIAVLKNGKTEFYIEVKDCFAQSGQFVLLPDEEKEVFVFSPRNHSKPNEMTEIIIDYMNRDFHRFHKAGTAGQPIDMDTKVFADWIVEYYKTKNVKYLISQKGEYVIFPVRRFPQYFEIKAIYRIKKSGSGSPAKKDIPAVIHAVQAYYPAAAFSQIEKKLYVSIPGSVPKDKFTLGKYTYYLSKQSSENYEVRRLSNTYNMNVIFSIELSKTQDEKDLDEFQSDIF